MYFILILVFMMGKKIERIKKISVNIFWEVGGKGEEWCPKEHQNTLLLSPCKKVCVICLIKSPLKRMKSAFLFYGKSSFRSQDIEIFVKTFWLCRKNGLVRKITLPSKFMTSQLSLQAIVIHVLANITHSKDNQTMKFGHLIEYNKINIFLQELCRKLGRETSSRPLFIFMKKLNIKLNNVMPYKKSKVYKTLDY